MSAFLGAFSDIPMGTKILFLIIIIAVIFANKGGKGGKGRKGGSGGSSTGGSATPPSGGAS